jgi:hypothetical protein
MLLREVFIAPLSSYSHYSIGYYSEPARSFARGFSASILLHSMQSHLSLIHVTVLTVLSDQ